MLAASRCAPNTPHGHAKPTPTPDGWHGVTVGMQNARSQATQGDYASAINTLHEILLFAPAEVAAWKLLARLQRKLGHIDAGIVSAKRALQLQNAQPGDRCAPISLTLAKLLWKQGEKADALEMLALLSAQEPDNAELQAIHELWEEGTST